MEVKQVVTFVENLLSARNDISNLSITVDGDGIDFYYEGGLPELDDRCIFDDCSRVIKVELLRFFFSQKFVDSHFCWRIGNEFAKLSAKDGALIEKEAEAFFAENVSENWCKYFLHIAFLGSNSLYEKRLVELLDVAREDSRDGLFIACWHNRSAKVQRALMSAFCKWMDRGELEAGTGEIEALRTFMNRWKDMRGGKAFERLNDFLNRQNRKDVR